METAKDTRQTPGNQPNRDHRASIARAAKWLGHVIVAQLIGYYVRHWLP